jgi:hypothetical protein
LRKLKLCFSNASDEVKSFETYAVDANVCFASQPVLIMDMNRAKYLESASRTWYQLTLCAIYCVFIARRENQ